MFRFSFSSLFPKPPPAKFISTTTWENYEDYYILESVVSSQIASASPLYPRTTEYQNSNLVECADGTWDVTNGFAPACITRGGVKNTDPIDAPPRPIRVPRLSPKPPTEGGPPESSPRPPSKPPVSPIINPPPIPYPFPKWNQLGGGGFNSPERQDVYGKLANPPIHSYKFVTDEPFSENWSVRPPKTFVSATKLINGNINSTWLNNGIAVNDSSILSSNLFQKDFILINSSFSDFYRIPTNLVSRKIGNFQSNGCVDATRITSQSITSNNLGDLSLPYEWWNDTFNDLHGVTSRTRSLISTRTSYYGLLAIPRASIKRYPVRVGLRSLIRTEFETVWINCSVTWRLLLTKYAQTRRCVNGNHKCTAFSPMPSKPIEPPASVIAQPGARFFGSIPPVLGIIPPVAIALPITSSARLCSDGNVDLLGSCKLNGGVCATQPLDQLSQENLSKLVSSVSKLDYLEFSNMSINTTLDLQTKNNINKIQRPVEAETPWIA